MTIVKSRFFILILLFFSHFELYSNSLEKNIQELEKEIKEYINHHVLDSHDFNLLSYTKEDGSKFYLGIPLPVILWDDGLVIFSSSKFKHGKSVVKSGENFYKLYHGKIYKTDSSGKIYYDNDK